jgi:glycosyltransferase involved in cell wall biosynthesis
MTAEPAQQRIAVIIPCYRVAATIAAVVAGIDDAVWRIYCVDDASPDDTATALQSVAKGDARVRVVSRAVNGGVGAAVLDGYAAARADGADVLVKIDGDGQMNPEFISAFAAPILAGEADYVKGNRFFNIEVVKRMPGRRLIGNAGLSFLTKMSSGYWDIFDPTNGYTAIHAGVSALLPADRIHHRYFFESDMLFRLGTLRARIIELPIDAFYGDEVSHLNVWHCLLTFPFLHIRNMLKRIIYGYFLRNFSSASLNLVIGLLLILLGGGYGGYMWWKNAETGTFASAGTVMLSALPFLTGMQLVLSFLTYDMQMTPSSPIHPYLARKRVLSVPTAKINESKAVE